MRMAADTKFVLDSPSTTASTRGWHPDLVVSLKRPSLTAPKRFVVASKGSKR